MSVQMGGGKVPSAHLYAHAYYEIHRKGSGDETSREWHMVF